MPITTWTDVTNPIAIDDHSARHEDTGADEISVLGLSGLLADDQHVLDAEVTAVAVAHALATAVNDFLVASGSGAFVKKTLAETLTILGKAVASGLASLDAGSLVVQNPANATATPTASKIPIADGSGLLDSWVTLAGLGGVAKSLYDAYSILMATSDNTPVALTIAEQTLIGRKTGGTIAALTGADALLAMGITALVAELNYVDGVTSAIQGQIDLKAPLASPTFTGTVTIPTPFTLGAVSMTAIAAELNLLDLAGLVAGQLLVATGAATAAWQSTGVKLSAPDISGIVTAAAALTMPAFTLGGSVTLNGQDFLGTVKTNTGISYETGSAAAPFDTGNADGAGVAFRARDTGVGLVQVGQMVGAADPYFGFGGSNQFKFYNSGIADFGSGALTNINIDSGTLNGVTITAPTINGTVVTTGLTMPAFTLGGTLNANGQLISGVHQLQSVDSIYSVIRRDGGSGWIFDVKGAGAGSKQVVSFSGNTDTPVVTWLAAAAHTGLNITSGQSLKVAGTQVVAAQGTAVADADGSLASVNAQLNTLLARMRTHGLIAT